MVTGPHPVGRPTELSRRAFLVGGAATVALAACGRGSNVSVPSPGPGFAGKELGFVAAQVELAVGDDRLAFAVFRDEVPIPFSRDAAGSLVATGPSGRARPEVELRTFPIVRSKGGEDAEKQSADPDLIFVARLPFDAPGPWNVRADLELEEGRTLVTGPLEVLESSRTVGVGKEPISVATPTVRNAGGVDPICTRVPPCTMQDISLDEALRNGKPTVVVFATPAFCTSRMCGPDVDIVESVYKRRAEEANFIHVEIYKDRSLSQPAPATSTWSIDKAGEPWVFFISRDGVVADRLSGPIGEWEVDEAVSRIARG